VPNPGDVRRCFLSLFARECQTTQFRKSKISLLDTIRVNHVSGGVSIIGLKTYASGREKFQGETLDYVWLDEEPPADIYTEALTRTNVGASPVWLTFTPLQGVSTVVKRFLHEQSPDRYKVVMNIDDVGHYSDDEKQKIIASYPAHEAEARVKGIPVLGSGRVFPVAEETIACEHRDFPDHWSRIGGMDFGWDHPFAAVELVWDRDSDTVYVSRTYRVRETSRSLTPLRCVRGARNCAGLGPEMVTEKH
jgi:phage terminase large subunit-like protein